MASPSAYLELIGKHQVKNLKTKKYVLIESLWSDDQDVVIMLVRWFGCILARYEAVKLGQIKGLLEESGVRVVIIGYSERFCEEYLQYWPGDLYLDLDKNCYQTLGLKKYSYFGLLLDTIMPSCQEIVDKAEELNIQYEVDGDGRQNGGLLVVRKHPGVSPNLLLMHREEYPGHRVPNGQLLECLSIDKDTAMQKIGNVEELEYEESVLAPIASDSALAQVCNDHTERAVAEAIVGVLPQSEQWELDYLLLLLDEH